MHHSLRSLPVYVHTEQQAEYHGQQLRALLYRAYAPGASLALCPRTISTCGDPDARLCDVPLKSSGLALAQPGRLGMLHNGHVGTNLLVHHGRFCQLDPVRALPRSSCLRHTSCMSMPTGCFLSEFLDGGGWSAGRRKGLLMACGLAALLACTNALAPSFWWYLLLQSGTGIGVAGVWLLSFAMATEPVGPAWQGHAGIATHLFFACGACSASLLSFLVNPSPPCPADSTLSSTYPASRMFCRFNVCPSPAANMYSAFWCCKNSHA